MKATSMGKKTQEKKIDALFKEEIETRTINAYTKMQNSSSLREMIENNKAETITISGIAMISKGDTFADKNDGILIPFFRRMGKCDGRKIL